MSQEVKHTESSQKKISECPRTIAFVAGGAGLFGLEIILLPFDPTIEMKIAIVGHFVLAEISLFLLKSSAWRHAVACLCFLTIGAIALLGDSFWWLAFADALAVAIVIGIAYSNCGELEQALQKARLFFVENDPSI